MTLSRPMTGADYLASLRDDREVWAYGRRVDDVTTHPAFRNQARMIARLYDALHTPDARSSLTCTTDTGSAGYTHRFFQASTTIEELVAARDAIATWQRIGFGWMGRSPDFMAAVLGMLGANADYFAPYQENARRWYQRTQEEVLFFNHALANPPVDRNLPPDEVDDIYIHVVKETDAGLIVSGVKNITTNAALTNYSFVASDGGSFVQKQSFAVIGIVPMNASGVKIICRPSYEMMAGIVGTPFDYPLSSRFDENDAICIFDQVLIPWENVLVYGDLHKYNNCMRETGAYNRAGLQSATRLAVKLDLIAGLLIKAVESTGVDQFRGVQVNVGEVLNWRHLIWSLSDSMARTTVPHQGVVLPSLETMMAYRMTAANAYSRVKEIIHNLVASGLVFQPTGARDFQTPELRPYLEKYLRSSNGDAVDRVKLMKMLWDAVGTEFAGRHELYERNNAGNHEAIRLHPYFEGRHSGMFDEFTGFVDAAMADYDVDGWTAPDLVNPTDVDFFQDTTAIIDEASPSSAYMETNGQADHIVTINGSGHTRSYHANDTSRSHQLSDAELHKILVEWNDTAADYPVDKCIHQLFEEQVERTPDAAAVYSLQSTVHQQSNAQMTGDFGLQTQDFLTYRELNGRANQLAHHLRSLGVGPETLVGIYLERSLDLIVSLLGILKAGGAYVPLSPELSAERLAFLLADTQVPVLLTQQSLREQLPDHPLEIVLADQNLVDESTENVRCCAAPQQVAYVIYTSGSTGKPNGVMIEHRGLCNSIVADIATFGLEPGKRFLHVTSFSFDAATSHLLMTLCAGATLYLAPRTPALLHHQLSSLLNEHAITHTILAPALLTTLTSIDLPTLEVVGTGGDICSAELVARWSQGRKFFNIYGPTEATITTTVARCHADGQKPTIGRPTANVQTYILDDLQRPIPIGETGELYIGGAGLARGYLNRPELTAQKFVEVDMSQWRTTSDVATNLPQFNNRQRLYKTGDSARWLPDGSIEFLGRLDNQIKLRGIRIELGEIEAALIEHTQIQEAAVTLWESDTGEKRLIAYLVQNDTDLTQTQEGVLQLRTFLSKTLPDHMIPAQFIALEALPLTVNDKVDRKALPAPPAALEETIAVEALPQDAIEETVAQIWARHFQRTSIGIHSNFFALGGHSLLAAQILAELKQIFRVSVAHADFFENPTVAGLAHLLTADEQTTGQMEKRARMHQRLQHFATQEVAG